MYGVAAYSLDEICGKKIIEAMATQAPQKHITIVWESFQRACAAQNINVTAIVAMMLHPIEIPMTVVCQCK